MNLKVLKDNIIYSSSTITRKRGEELYEKGLIKSVKGKNIGDSYHIYGAIENKSGNMVLETHIRIEKDKNKLGSCNCSCLDYKENSEYNSRYICEHMIGIILKFHDMANKKMGRDNKKVDKVSVGKNEKEELRLKLKIKYISHNEKPYYNCEVRIGNGKESFLVDSINEFIVCKNNIKPYRINSSFTYNPNIHYFSDKNEELLDFINEYCELNKLINKSSNSLIIGSSLRIIESSIKRFLEVLKDREINFIYEHRNFISKIYVNKIPLDLYGEFQNGELLISHRKSNPIELNHNGDALLYDGNIYIFNKEKLKDYKELMKKLEKKKLKIKKESIASTLDDISNISNNITFSNSMKNFIIDNVDVIFKFNKDKENKITCKYDMGKYNEVDFNKFDRDIFKGSLKSKKIEISLEKFSFKNRGEDFEFIGGEEELFILLKSGISELSKLGSIESDGDFNSVKILNNNNILCSIDQFGNKFEFSYNIDEFTTNDIRGAIDALKEGKRFYKGMKNNYLDLEDSKVKEFLNLIDLIHGDNELSKDIIINTDKALYIEGKINSSKLDFIDGKDRLNKLKDTILNEKVISPKELKGNLRDYQLKGYNWLLNLKKLGLGAILADDMGLGKTIQSISFLLGSKCKRALIITPTALIYNWEDEMKKFAPHLKLGLVHGEKKKRNNIIENLDNYDVIITSYGTLKNDRELYKDINFEVIIIDEGQNIKNYKSQTAKYIKELRGDFKIALTGTPIENNLMELWSIFDFIMPGYLYGIEEFKERFVDNNEKAKDLKLLISPFILRRLKTEVLKELPEKIEKKYFVELTGEQGKIYKSYVRELKEKLKVGGNNSITLFSYLTKLRELCLDPTLIIDTYKGNKSKFKVLLDIINNNRKSHGKTLLFSQFTSALKNFEDELKESNIEYLYLDGTTGAKERLQLVKEFNESDKDYVFLISLKAGGTGLNLTAANLVVHLDPWWNLATENQATDRAYRMGQKNMVEVIKLIAKGTVEETILKLQEEKKELINSVIDQEFISEGNLSKLNSEELIKLL